MSSKPKYNPDDVERWVTVRGKRIPVLKDGTLGVGKDDEPNINTEAGMAKKMFGKSFSELTDSQKDEVTNAVINHKPTSKNERYNTSRVGKKKPTALEAFKENSRQLNVALEEGQKRNALEVHYTDMTGKVYKHYWNGAKFVADKIKQDMAKKYGKKAGIYKASFKKPKEWE